MRPIVFFALAIVGFGKILSASEPILTGFDPDEATLGQEMILEGSGLAEAIKVYGFDWRGHLMPFPILSSNQDSIRVEV